ncbi:hypothetical protein MMC11_006131 [Xylographa trunciseda]|nr:hypothetical protein [Xylographa trunciseda]
MAGQGGTATYYRQYSTVSGYFLQDDTETDPTTFDYTALNFGLKAFPNAPEEVKPRWQMFEERVRSLNDYSDPSVQYKVLFLGRHGQGVHNVAEAQYGTQAWDCKWSLLETDGTLSWADAHLTPLGIAQAQTAHDFWATQLADQKMPAPQSYYTSPLDRCLMTAQITFSELELPVERPFVPTVKELVRETIGLHACDRRSSKTYIHTHYPSYIIEPTLTENDELWSADLRESDSAIDLRLMDLLDDIFEHDKNTWMSFTSHSGAIAGLLRVLGHRPFPLLTGAVIPVLVRAELVEGIRPRRKAEEGKPAPACSGE